MMTSQESLKDLIIIPSTLYNNLWIMKNRTKSVFTTYAKNLKKMPLI